MDLKNYIKEYENALNPKQVSAFLRTFRDNKEFCPAGVFKNHTTQIIDKKTRVVDNYGLKKHISFTETHWRNFLNFKFSQAVEHYIHSCGLNYIRLSKVTEITLLRYKKGGFYNIHTDHLSTCPRDLSLILFLNNDYKGGDLEFYSPDGKELMYVAKPQVGKLVIWPSYFLFPHQASPVLEGERFVVVSWMN